MAKVGDQIQAENANWSFGGNVAATFDAHVSKSVPLYEQGHELVAKVSDYFLTNGSVCYELGCSTGALTHRLAERNKSKSVKFIACDLEEKMAEHARERLRPFKNVTVIHGDIVELDLEPADFIVSYYTMQFIRPKFRQDVFDRIYKALNWGGAFVLFEKVRACDARFQDMMTTIYNDFKLDQGYDEAEIVGKARSLKGVLEPFSTQGNIDLMKRAGFVDVMTIQKYVSFEGFLAIK